MMTTRFSLDEHETIRRCLAAAVDGPFFPEWEFDTLIGASRKEVRALATEWPPDSTNQQAVDIASSVISNLLGYPHGEERTLHSLVAASLNELNALLQRLNQ